jgi:hypothetical protein
MFVQGIERYRRSAHLKDTGPPDQGDVVEVDHIEITVEHSSELCRFDSGIACLLGDQRRQHPEGAAQAMYHNTVLLGLHSRLLTALQAVGVFAVHYFDMVSFRDQCASQCLNKHSIPAKMVWRIECGHHAKAHRSFP